MFVHIFIFFRGFVIFYICMAFDHVLVPSGSTVLH
jgi:hypothetical protein